jgi:hypothetical protein
MIPTFRSMIVAALFTLTALVGGFGLFAAFRVNHEPLARLPASTTQFALADNGAAPQALSFASELSFGSRLESNAALIAINTASISGRDPGAVNSAAGPSSGPVTPENSNESAPAATAAVDIKTDDASPPVASTKIDPKTDDGSRPAAVAGIDPEADSPAPAAVAVTVEADPKAGNAGSPKPDGATAPAPQIAAAEPANDQPSSDPASAQAAVTAPVVENSQPETTSPNTASPAGPAPTVTAAITPTASVPAAHTDEEAAAREIAKRKRLAAARRAHRARVLAAAQTANQNGLFPQTNFQSASSQVTFQPAQRQAVGGPFTPAPATTKARLQNYQN